MTWPFCQVMTLGVQLSYLRLSYYIHISTNINYLKVFLDSF